MKHSSGDVQQIIIDTDPGIDDAMAIFFALSCEELKVEALTIVFGNSHDTNILAENACRVLTMSGRPNIPVYKGSKIPIVSSLSDNSGAIVHGENGLGNVSLPPIASLSKECATIREDKTAAQAIIDICKASPGKVIIIALGPLSNLAIALKLCPELPSIAKGVVLMGGALNIRGNKSPVAEANFHNWKNIYLTLKKLHCQSYSDPEAAKIVLNACFNLTMVPLNVTRQVHMNPDFLEELKGLGEIGNFLWDIVQHYINIIVKWGTSEHEIPMHDSSAIMAVVKGEFFTGKNVYVDVETKGERTAGMCIPDWKGHYKKTEEQYEEKMEKTKVLLGVDATAFKYFYLKKLRLAFWKE